MSDPQTLSQELEEKLSTIEKDRIEQQAKDLAKANKLSYINIAINPIEPEALALISEEDSRTGQIGAISRDGKKIRIVAVDPNNSTAKKIIAHFTDNGFSVTAYIISSLGIQKLWEKYKDLIKPSEEELGTVAIDKEVFSEVQQEIKNIGDLKEKLKGLSATNVLEIVLAGAIKIGASDIHLESEEKTVRIRYRLDGVLNDVVDIDPENYAKVLARIKINSGLKICRRETQASPRIFEAFCIIRVTTESFFLKASLRILLLMTEDLPYISWVTTVRLPFLIA